MTRRNPAGVIWPVTISLIAAASFAWPAEKKMDIKDVPPAVRAALEDQAKGGKIIDVDLSEDSGKPVYTSEIHVNGEEIDVQVSPDGTLLSKEPGNPPVKTHWTVSAMRVAERSRYWVAAVGFLLILFLWRRKKKEA